MAQLPPPSPATMRLIGDAPQRAGAACILGLQCGSADLLIQKSHRNGLREKRDITEGLRPSRLPSDKLASS